MKREEWAQRIRAACLEAGTYRPFFDHVIDTLAQLMETRDAAQEKYILSGGDPVVLHTNKAGATNVVKNPALMVIMDCQAQALAYWRDLGLTPAGLKKIDEKAIKAPKKNALAEALKDIG